MADDRTAAHWHVYKSVETGGESHQKRVDHGNELANEWLAQSLSDRIAAPKKSELDT